MNGPVSEVRRLRQQVAEKDAELAELRGLVQKHLEATADADQRCLDRERAAFERGHREGNEFGYRRGVEHALVAVEEAHLQGTAHDGHGLMRELGLHNGPVPEPMDADQRVAAAERYSQLRAAWTAREYERSHPQAEADDLEIGA